MKRGHSNVDATHAEKWDTPPDCCKLRLTGGATASTCRELPPLALHRDDWEQIGKFMGWLPSEVTHA